VMGLDIGHHERNFTLPVGWPVELQADTGQLSTWLPE
jgi:muramoyltetrapeptide carboxypeptidase LdcA involved in peptidoglycan recycling